jgi:fatty-acyl-CoA synthase
VIGQQLLKIARTEPEYPALIVRDTPMSFPQLLWAGGEVGRVLASAGVRAGDVVACALPVRWEAVASFVGCALMGAVFLPVNPSWSREELAWLIARVDPTAAIVVEEDAWLAAGLPLSRLIVARGWPWPEGDGLREEVADVPAGHPVAYQLSSGSTGQPKIVMKSGDRFLASMQNVASAVGVGSGRRILVSTPFHFGFSFSWNMLLPLVSGATMVLLERFEPSAAAEVVMRQKVTCLWGSPVLYGLLTGAQLPAGSLRGLELCFAGGAPLSAAVKEQWRCLSGAELRQAYGTTEAGMIAIQQEERLPDGCVGLPPPGTEIRICRDDQVQPTREAGEIAVRGPGVMTGYLKDAAATSALMDGAFLRTGDSGWMDDRGRLYLTGRIRPWINAGGIKVDPVEVQNALRGIPGVCDCLVRGEPGPRGVDLVAADIAVEPGVVLTRTDVIRYCRERLAGYKVPRVIRFLPASPHDLTGKLAHPPRLP